MLTLLFVTALVNPVPPAKVSVSVPSVIVSVPLSPAISVVVTMLTLCVLTAVTKPFAFTVTTGIAEPLPKLPTLLFTVARVAAPLLATVKSPLNVL